MSAVSKGETAGARFPAGLNNAFMFAVFNALSFQIILSSPMVLYAKSLGASATVLGIIAGMMPLMVVFQIPAASYVVRIGYKRFVYAGWGTRVMFIFGMAAVPVTGFFLNATTQLSLMIMLLFGFNLSRGISSCAWLPWITSLVPAAIRGRYLAIDSACVNLASFGVFVLAAFCLGAQPTAWRFSLIFAISAVMGAVSLTFLKRIPEGETLEQVRVSAAPVPWREIAGYQPFRKLLRVNMVWSLAYGGLTAFVVAFLKTELGLSERTILLVTAVSFLGGLSSLWFLGSHMDRHGSQPVLKISFLAWVLIQIGWTTVAAGLCGPRWPLILGLQFMMGLAGALVSMANVRLAMAIIPLLGRNHFFVLFSVVGNLTQGIAPILWGLLLDALGPREWRWSLLVVNRYVVFFVAVAVFFSIAFILSRWLEEPRATRMEDLLREVFIDSPMRFWVRFWPR
jgi:MFS family permease